MEPYVECEFELTEKNMDVLSKIDEKFSTIAKRLKNVVVYREGDVESNYFNEDTTTQIDEIIKSSKLLPQKDIPSIFHYYASFKKTLNGVHLF